MRLRLKLLLAQAPLMVALGLLGVFAVGTLAALGRFGEDILRENYRSVLAAQRMKEAIERLQDAALERFVGDGTAAVAPHASVYRRRVEEELRVEEDNLTEPGEREAAERLRAAWTTYERDFDQCTALADREAARRFLAGPLDASFTAVREAADAVLLLNQDAIVYKTDRTKREAARMGRWMLLAALAALGVGTLATAAVTTRLLQPLALLTRTVTRIGEGDFDARVVLPGTDELAQLAGTVNAMAMRLGQYRRSSLGELLLAQAGAQAAIDSLPDPVVIYEPGGRVLNLNRAGAEVLGIEVGAARAASDTSLAPALRDAVEKACSHALGGKGVYVPRGFDAAVALTTPGGERQFLPRATPIYAENGSIMGAAVVLQDVTRLRRVDELRRNLVGAVAREVRTPLASLRLAIHVLIEQAAGPLSERQTDLLYAARDDCERLQATVDEMLNLAHIERGRIELHRRPTAVEALVDAAVDAVRTAAEHGQLALETEVAPGLGELAVDRERVQLVFANLLGNALRHTRPGGHVTVRAYGTDDSVRFDVVDTGAGIPPEFHRLIFEHFVRLPGDTSGVSGLGLPIARDIIEAHGGRIGVESTPGAGATFWFTLPRGDPSRLSRAGEGQPD